MAKRSVDNTLNVPPAPPTDIDLAPLGRSVTVPDPALTPVKETSLAVMVMGELVDEIDVAPLFVTLPVPSVVIVTPLVPVALALSVTAPLDPDDVCNTSVLPEKALEAVILPLAIKVNVPLVEVMVPEVPMLAEAPVVVSEKLPPTVEAPRVTAPALETSAVPAPPLLMVRVPVAAVKIGVPDDPIVPVPEVRDTVGPLTVTEPERVIVPEPLAFMVTLPLEPVETLALIAMPELLPLVDKLTVEAPDIAMLELTPTPIVSVPPELTVTEPVEPEMPPNDVVLEAPVVVIARLRAPIVIVWLADVKAPPLLNCKLKTPAGPAPDTLTAPPTVKPPACDVVPTIRVPAVIAPMSDAAMENVPPVEENETDFAPLGTSVTVPLPALSVPERVTSLAVIDMGVLPDVEIALDAPLVKLPVPSVVAVIPVVPVAFAFKAMVPLLPDDVVNTKELPERALEAVRLPFVVIVSVPVLDVIAPVVVRLAEDPVVVKENVLPTVEAPMLTAPALVTKAVPPLPEFAVRLELALV